MTGYCYEDPRSIYSEQNIRRAHTRTPQEILAYFQNPDKGNLPEDYLSEDSHTRSERLVRVVKRLFPNPTLTLLELGSGTGRNLHHLKKAGYHRVSGIEQSSLYLDTMREQFPELAGHVLQGTIEDILPQLPNKYDLVLTMAVLEHIPVESVHVFDEIARVARWLLLIEDEKCVSWRHFPRNYREVFEARGMKHLKAWKFPGMSAGFAMRLFKEGSQD